MSTPVPFTAAPGNFLTAALWNSTITAAMKWAFTDGPPRFQGYCSVGQSLTTGTTYASVALGAEVFDSVGGHSTATNPERYTCVVPGLYHVIASGSLAASAAGSRSVRISKNGGVSAGPGSQAVVISPGSVSWWNTVSALVPMVGGDYITVDQWQSSGGALLTLTGTQNGTSLSALWVSP